MVNAKAANKVLNAPEPKSARCEQFCSLITSASVVASHRQLCRRRLLPNMGYVSLTGSSSRRSDRWRTRFQLALLSAALFIISFGHAHAQSAERAPDAMAARVLACASCHGDKGQGTNDDYFPRLAGKPAGYLYNQLVAFRDGRRKYPPTNYLLETSRGR